MFIAGYPACSAMTNRRLDTIMENLKDMFDNDFHGYPENINCDSEFDKKQFVDFFTSQRNDIIFLRAQSASQELCDRKILEDSCTSSAKNEGNTWRTF